MTSLLHLRTTNGTDPIRPSQREEDIPRMHFTGVNMLILAQHPMSSGVLHMQEAGSGYVKETRTVYVQ